MDRLPVYNDIGKKSGAVENKALQQNRAASLWEIEERYRRVVETMGDGLSEIDENGIATYANRRLSDMWGYDCEEILGRPVSDFLDEENRQVLEMQLKKRRLGKRDPYEIVWTRKNGTKLHTLMTPTPHFDVNGRFMGSFAVITDISISKREREALKKSRNELQQKLLKRTKELEIKTKHLEEVNTALRVLLKKRNEDKKELEERMVLNVRELIMPYLEKLKTGCLSERQQVYLDILESTLNDIISPFLHDMASKFRILTPAEIQVANLVRQGRSSKEIAEILSVSPKTVETHRKSIRAKIGIKNKRVNLRTYLKSLH